MTSMMLDDPSRYAALVAPAVDRCAISVHPAVDKSAMAALRGEHRFAPQAFALFAGTLAAGPISMNEFSELLRYRHFGSPETFLNGLVERGAVTVNSDGSFETTEAARDVAKQVVELQCATIDSLWAPRRSSHVGLRVLADRAVAAAVADDSVLARYNNRSWLPENASDAAVIWTACVTLRMHRSDAHARAWAERGHTADSVRELESGAEREAIEARTNELASPPWAALTADERLAFLAGLAALPGTGSPI